MGEDTYDGLVSYYDLEDGEEFFEALMRSVLE
jgi:hypothetical protein